MVVWSGHPGGAGCDGACDACVTAAHTPRRYDPLVSVSRPVRLRRAATLGSGAAVAAVLLLGDDPVLPFFWVPLVVGLAYLVTALAGGGMWSTALPLTGWGLGVVSAVEDWLDLYDAALFLLGAGLGALAAALLERRGAITADLLGVSATLVLGALAFALEREVGAFGEARTYVALLAAVAVFNLIAARRA